MKKLTLLLLLIFAIQQSFALTKFVTVTGAGLQDGSSWGNAIAGSQLKTSIDAAAPGTDFWIAAGTYYPGTSGNSSASFNLIQGVNLYGGFNGTEVNLNDRNATVNVTRLSGDLDQSGTHTAADAYHVLYGTSGYGFSVISDLTIEWGNATGSSNPTNSGGGVYMEYGSTLFSNCVFTNNTGGYGGVAYLFLYAAPTFDRCTIIRNTGSVGGAFYIQNYGSPTSVVFKNSVFSTNYGSYFGSSIARLEFGKADFYCCSFGHNFGGVINSINNGSSSTLKNCVVWGSGGVDGNSSVSYCDIEGGVFPGIGNISVDPLFINSFTLELSPCSPAINAGDNTGAPTVDVYGNPRVFESVIDMGAIELQTPAQAPGTCPPIVYYVNDNATGSNDGTSWANAYTNLQDAISNAISGQIWVAEGTYYPGTSGNTGARFEYRNNIQVYGGFNGTETLLSQRDFRLHPTILSGDLNQSGTIDGNDALSVVHASGVDSTAVFDGFVISGGNATGSSIQTLNGGGVCFELFFSSPNTPLLNNCIIENNNHGIGVINWYGNTSNDPKITNCIVRNNTGSATSVFCYSSGGSPRFENVLVYNNSGYTTMSNQGGTPVYVNCTFYNNPGTYQSFSSDGSTTTLNNCIVQGSMSGTYVGNNNIHNSGTITGTNNTNVDPLFINAAANDFHLVFCSPAKNAGDNSAVSANNLTDLDGNPRVFQSTVDIGAYEEQSALSAILATVTISSNINNVCEGTPITFTAVSTDGGSNPIYEFFVNGVSKQNGSSATFTTSLLLNGDVVTCNLTSDAFCVSPATVPSNNVTMVINPLPTVGITASAAIVCTGGSVTLNGTGAASYSWSGGITDGVSFIPPSSATYTVIGTDAFGCSNSASQVITVGNIYAQISASGPTTFCSNDSVTLSVATQNHPMIFNGSNCYVRMRDFGIGTQDFTIETWLKPQNYGGSIVTDRVNPASPHSFEIVLDANGQIFLQLVSTSLPTANFTGSSSLPLNTWSHIAVVRNGTNILMYVNGVLDGSFIDPVIRDFTNQYNVAFLSEAGWAGWWYQGAMDQFRVWHVARSAAEIMGTKNSIINGAYPSLNNNYTMSETSGNYQMTDAASGNTGTIVNGTREREMISTSPATIIPISSYLWSDGSTTPSITVHNSGAYNVQLTSSYGCSATSNTINVTVNTIAGNPAVFGNNQWNVYAWNAGEASNTGSSWNTNYSGYYVATGLDFNTENDWGSLDAPSSAANYQGCDVAIDNHSWSAKRQGFPCGIYQINIAQHDDQAELYINGNLIFQHIGCCDNHSNVWTGFLSSTDQIEFRVTEGSGGSVGELNFIPLSALSGATSFCDGGSVVLTAPSDPNISSYLWSTGETTSAITVTSGGTYSVTIGGPAGCTITESKTVVKNPLPVLSATSSPSTPQCPGTPITLTGSGAATLKWNVSNATIPLDNVSGASLAIGLRKLKSSYSGPCIRLRRSSDDSEMDFGFVGNDLNTSAISIWLGGATGYCVRIYDQSGNGGDVFTYYQSTQPTFVSSGINGNPVLHFNTTQTLFNQEDYTTTAFTAIYGGRQTGGARERVLSSLYSNWLLGYWGGAKRQAYFEGWVSSNPGNPASDDNFYIYSGASNGVSSQLYENGNLIENNSGGINGPYGIELNGWQFSNEMSDCDFTDVILFSSVLSNADRSFVESSIQDYYASNHATVTVAPMTNSTYTLVGIDNNGCSSTLSTTVNVLPTVNWYQDADNDGYGNPASIISSCAPLPGYVNNNTDCNDADANVHPGAIEICNGYDDDCDGLIDNGVAGPDQPGAISYSGLTVQVCRGETRIYSVAAVPGASSYAWILPAGATGSSTSNNITVVFGSAFSGGQISVAAVNSCNAAGASSSLTIPVITGYASVSAVVGPTITCGPQVATFSTTGTNALSYTWRITGTGVSILTGQGTNTITVNIPSGFSQGSVQVYATNCYGNSSTKGITITGIPGHSNAVTGPSFVCADKSASYSMPVVPGATSFAWTSTSGITLQSSSQTSTNYLATFNFGSTFVSGIITITVSNSCGSYSRSFAVRSVPDQPGSISGPSTSLCGLTNVAYSISPVAGATTYTWTVPTGVSIVSSSGTGIVVNFTPAFTGTGNICVNGNNGCGSGPSRCYAVSARPAVPVVSGISTVCKSQSAVAYSVSPVAGASSYNWSITGGASIAPSGTTASVNFTTAINNTANIRVNAVNACGASQPAGYSVSVNQLCHTASSQTEIESGDFEVYPNPANKFTTVSFDGNDNSKVLLKMTNLIGEEILNRVIAVQSERNTIELDLTDLAKGVYLITLQSDNQDPKTKRLVVE